jgi:hypothetical protein
MISKDSYWLRNLKKLMWFAVVAGCCAGLPKDAVAAASCFCKAIINVGNTAGTSIPNPLLDLGVVATYGTAIGHNADCENKCSQAASNNANFNNKTWWCQQIHRPGHFRVSAYAAVGANGTYRVAQSIEFDCSGGVMTCTCPKGWIGDNGADGGVTTNQRKCSRLACQPILHAPPPNDTKIGTGSPLPWGFSWGNAFYEFGSSANGGAPRCETSPWIGK